MSKFSWPKFHCRCTLIQAAQDVCFQSFWPSNNFSNRSNSTPVFWINQGRRYITNLLTWTLCVLYAISQNRAAETFWSVRYKIVHSFKTKFKVYLLELTSPPGKLSANKSTYIFYSPALCQIDTPSSWWPTTPLLPGATRKGWLPHRSKADWRFSKSNYYNTVYLLWPSRIVICFKPSKLENIFLQIEKNICLNC